MRYSAVALLAALTASVSASPMMKRGEADLQPSGRPYPSQSGRPFPSKGPMSSAAPFPSWKPNPSHKPMPTQMSEECEVCDYSHFYYSSDCDDECRYSYDVYYYYEDCDVCDKSLQPAYPTYDCTTTAAAPVTPSYHQNTVTVYVEPTEGCSEFLKNNPTCTYCETTVTSKTKSTAYVTSTPACLTCTEEDTCGAATVTVSTTPCTTLATVTPCAGCVEQYVTTQGQLVSSCITSTSACSTYQTETASSLCVYGAMTTTVTYPTTITYTATTSCGSGDSYCNVMGKQYPCPTTVYYETVTACATGVFTLGGMTSACPTSACSVTYPTYCPDTTTYAWYSTVTSACESCPVATVTAADCSITSIKSGYKATSTYCSTSGVYTCGTEVVTIATPTWYHYVELCPTQYVCSYEEWCKQNKHFVVYEYIGTYLQDSYECDVNEYEQSGLWVHPIPTSQYFTQPTIVVINNIEINITVAPTWYTYTTLATETTTATVTTTVTGAVNPGQGATSTIPSASPSTGAVVGSFSLTGLVDGEPVVLIAQDGTLIATTDPNAVATTFLPITNGVLEDINGNVYVIAALGSPITYTTAAAARFVKRDLNIVWVDGAIGLIAEYLGEALIYSACVDSFGLFTINCDTTEKSGCSLFQPIKASPGIHPGAGTTSTAPSSVPTSAPTSEPTSAPSVTPSASPSNPVSAEPSSAAPSVAPSSAPNSTNGTNSTVQRRDFQRRFVF
jgi:hypothetical protein